MDPILLYERDRDVNVTRLAVITLCAAIQLALASTGRAEPLEFSWQATNARVLPTGQIEWAPKAFVYRAGQETRYIDFDRGDDANDGRTPRTAWKHHPWDPNAQANAAAEVTADTYVFRRGVTYRGALGVERSGSSTRPIRLTSDPAWGGEDAEAVISGAEAVSGWQRVTARSATTAAFPDPALVWFTDLPFAPRNVWAVAEDGEVIRLPLARTPNWTVSNPEDVKSEWFVFDNPGNPHFKRVEVDGKERFLGVDTKNLTHETDYYDGAYVWTEYGWVMGTPYPSRIVKYFPDRNGIAIEGQWSGVAGTRHLPRYSRYFLEDKPHYLDDPAGEFFFDRRGNGGRLFVIPPDGVDPNEIRIEAARHATLIDATEANHVEITGLTFRFTNTKWELHAPPFAGSDVEPAVIRWVGRGEDIAIANNRFEHVNLPVRLVADGEGASIDRIRVSDNVIRETDHGGMQLLDGSDWGEAYPTSRLYDVKVLRNRLHRIGLRPTRYGQGHAIEVLNAETAELSGNVMTRLWGAGIFVYGGKRSGAKVDRPLSRILIHHNSVVDSMLNSNDWGGIETWQGGPAYVFNNVSGNPGGYKMWGHRNQPNVPGTARFGHAYYMDGGFKQYYFNNIAWGRSADPFDPMGNTAAFQEIHGFLANVFNNTAYNFVIGSRRQAPQAGMNKYLGNVWHTIGHMVFRHADPRNQQADPNAADADTRPSKFQHATNAYAGNVFYNPPSRFGVFEQDGQWYGSLGDFTDAVDRRGSIGEVGVLADFSPLQSPAAMDFRPTEAVRDRGVRVFVPWGLYGSVGEWHFYPMGDDSALIPDEHFHLAPYYVKRDDYPNQPRFPLRVADPAGAAFVDGPLEDWAQGSLRLDGSTYLTIDAELLNGPSPLEGSMPMPANEPQDWIEFHGPDNVTPGKAIEVRLDIGSLDEASPQKLRADLHWVATNGRFGGVNARGGKARDLTNSRSHVIRFTPKDHPRLGYFTVTAWLSPDGEWANRTRVARYHLSKFYGLPDGGYRTPRVGKRNFLVEAYLKLDTGSSRSGESVILASMKDGVGYEVMLDDEARPVIRVADERQSASTVGDISLSESSWSHLVFEVDRGKHVMRIYVDGRLVAEGNGVGPVDIGHDGPVYVGGTPSGRGFLGELEFLRICLGTLENAKTTIDELCAWQFDGPAQRDFAGLAPIGPRDAGALETATPSASDSDQLHNP